MEPGGKLASEKSVERLEKREKTRARGRGAAGGNGEDPSSPLAPVARTGSLGIAEESASNREWEDEARARSMKARTIELDKDQKERQALLKALSRKAWITG